MSSKFDIALVGGVGGMIIIALSLYFLFMKEGYDVNTISDSNKILTADNDGNISILPNHLNDLQRQINAMSNLAKKTQLTNITNNVNNLTTNVNNIINGTTPLKNTKVSGTVTADKMIVLNMKTSSTPTPK